MIKIFFLKHKMIIFFLIFALLLRFPWLYTALEKDEGSFGYVAWNLLSGEKLYVDLGDDKSPLLYIIYSIPILLFGNSIIPIRILNNLLFLVSIIFFFKITEQFFTKRNALFSTLFYTVFMNVPVFEGYLAMSESLLIPFLLISIYLFGRYTLTKKHYLIFLSSVFASVSLLIKQQAIFIFFLLISELFIYKEEDKTKKIASILFVPIAIIFSISFFDKQLFLNLLQKTWEVLTQSSMGFSYGYQPYTYNLLIIIEGSILFLFAIIGLIKIFRSKKKEREYFLISWLFLASLFTLIPPAYGHYYILLIPPLAIFAGIGLIYSINTHQSKALFILLIIVLSFFTGMLVKKHFPDTSIDTKYLHYQLSNLASYNQQIRLAEFIKNTTKPIDEIFVFDWEPGIYWLSERRPPKDLGAFYKPDFAKWPSLRNRLREQKNLTLGIFFSHDEDITKYFDFLSNRKTVDGVSIYEVVNKNRDSCYLALIRKKKDAGVCERISTSFLRKYCLALLSLDFKDCYGIKRLGIMNRCFFDIALETNSTNVCDMIKNEDFFNFCVSRLEGEFNHTSCLNSFKQGYTDKNADYRCRIYYAQFTKDIHQCNHIDDSDANLLCKEQVTSDKVYCENIKDKNLYARCMAQATLNPDYCKEISKSE